MKDYSFGNKEYQSDFIKKYRHNVEENAIIVYYADGSKEVKSWDYLTKEQLEKQMASQIEKAYSQTQNFVINFGENNFIEYLKKYVLVKSKVKDIIKNKKLLDNLDTINNLYGKNYCINDFDSISYDEMELMIETIKTTQIDALIKKYNIIA